jgi:hypothetical protein
MLFREIIAVYSENHAKPVKTLCGQKTELLNVKGTHSTTGLQRAKEAAVPSSTS